MNEQEIREEFEDMVHNRMKELGKDNLDQSLHRLAFGAYRAGRLKGVEVNERKRVEALSLLEELDFEMDFISTVKFDKVVVFLESLKVRVYEY